MPSVYDNDLSISQPKVDSSSGVGVGDAISNNVESNNE